MSNLISNNLKYLRKQLNLTQEQLAAQVGIKRSLLGAYEEGRADPRLNNLQRMAEIFNVSVDQLISIDFTQRDTQDAPTTSKAQSPLKVLAISVDKNERENIELVPQKAAAGYLNGYADPEYIEELPRFQLPFLPSSQTYRAFEISGDSMLPILPGTIVIGSYLEQASAIKNGKTYILVTQREGVVYKRVFLTDDKKSIQLVSDNTAYTPYLTRVEDVLEIWEAKAYISLDFPDADSSGGMSLQKIAGIVMDLQQEVIKLKYK